MNTGPSELLLSGEAGQIRDAGANSAGGSARPDQEAITSTQGLRTNLFWVLTAAAAFHLAYLSWATSFCIVVYLFALIQLARNDSTKKAFYCGLAVGLLIAFVRLEFLWKLFGGGAIALWFVYAFWIGLFTAFARLFRERLGPKFGTVLVPFVWCGLEYFRSELYYLRFSWLSPGYAFSTEPHLVPFHSLGIYGAGFLFAFIASIAAALWQKSKTGAVSALCCGVGLIVVFGIVDRNRQEDTRLATVHVAGVQMEFPSEPEVIVRLNELIRKHPDAELVVLSEYTFNDPVPEKVKLWCRQHHLYLVVGGKDPAASNDYYDTGFVVSAAGEVIFRQGKKVPIQFFKDGLPAPSQSLWESPWGKVGICICYDLSYRRVTDKLVDLGAQLLIVPTMDVVDWGLHQHALHARVAPVRAAEYGLPIFRVASSGISQLIDARGHTVASAPCPGDGAMLSGVVEMRSKGHVPLDRWFAPLATALTALMMVGSLFHRHFISRKRVTNPP